MKAPASRGREIHVADVDVLRARAHPAVRWRPVRLPSPRVSAASSRFGLVGREAHVATVRAHRGQQRIAARHLLNLPGGEVHAPDPRLRRRPSRRRRRRAVRGDRRCRARIRPAAPARAERARRGQTDRSEDVGARGTRPERPQSETRCAAHECRPQCPSASDHRTSPTGAPCLRCRFDRSPDGDEVDARVRVAVAQARPTRAEAPSPKLTLHRVTSFDAGVSVADDHRYRGTPACAPSILHRSGARRRPAARPERSASTGRRGRWRAPAAGGGPTTRPARIHRAVSSRNLPGRFDVTVEHELVCERTRRARSRQPGDERLRRLHPALSGR